jgi:hypothetical protein
MKPDLGMSSEVQLIHARINDTIIVLKCSGGDYWDENPPGTEHESGE